MNSTLINNQTNHSFECYIFFFTKILKKSFIFFDFRSDPDPLFPDPDPDPDQKDTDPQHGFQNSFGVVKIHGEVCRFVVYHDMAPPRSYNHNLLQ